MSLFLSFSTSIPAYNFVLIHSLASLVEQQTIQTRHYINFEYVFLGLRHGGFSHHRGGGLGGGWFWDDHEGGHFGRSRAVNDRAMLAEQRVRVPISSKLVFPTTMHVIADEPKLKTCLSFFSFLSVLRLKTQKFILEVDVSNGPVTSEIIQYHLVPAMQKSFNKRDSRRWSFVRDSSSCPTFDFPCCSLPSLLC